MNKICRFGLIAGAMAAFGMASAQVNFSLVTAYYTLDAAGPFAFNYIPNGGAGTVDFTAGAPAFKVGDSTTYASGVGTIIYTVSSNVPIFGIDLTLQGEVEQFGEVNWTETAETSSGNLGSISGVVHGSSYTGGVDGAYTQVAHLTFNTGVTEFKVKKTFDIDIAANLPPSQSVASVTLIEQNMTAAPEPASLIGLALGGSAFLARRRNKKK